MFSECKITNNCGYKEINKLKYFVIIHHVVTPRITVLSKESKYS